MVTMEHEDDEFEAFFRQMIGRVMRSVTRIEHDSGTAEDAAIEAFARAHLHWGSVGPDPHREAWVLRVAVNAAIDQGRRNRRHRRPPEPARALGIAEHSIADRLWIADELRRLPKRQREAIVLRYIADLSERDVADAMGITVGSVKVHVHRGMKALGRSMGAHADEEAVDVPS